MNSLANHSPLSDIFQTLSRILGVLEVLSIPLHTMLGGIANKLNNRVRTGKDF